MAKKRATSGLGQILGYQSRTDAAIDQAVAKGGDVGLVPLFSVLPDPEQPRDLLPEDLYDRLFSGETPTTILQHWISRTNNNSDASPAQKRSVDALIQLARTIEQHDLIQPIAVTELVGDHMPDGVERLIVAGERRWWAHVWLYVNNKKIADKRIADKIKAILLPPESNIRAMQLVENAMREGLTAIERARGLYALRQEMSKGQKKLVPWAAVERELGIDRAYRWRIEQVLKLDEAAQEIVRWHGLAERSIRPITSNLQDRPDLQVKALRQLVAWQQANEDTGNARLATYIRRLLDPQKAKPAAPDVAELKKLGQAMARQAKKTVQSVRKLDDESFRQMAISLAKDKKAQADLVDLAEQIAQMREYWE